MMNTSNFKPYVAPSGVRIPILPLLGAIYYDPLPGLSLWEAEHVDLDQFMADFNLSPQEFIEYFDDDQTNHFNERILKADNSISYTPVSQILTGETAKKKARKQSALKEDGDDSEPPVSTVIPAAGVQVPPPEVNTGWSAEQFVIRLLQENGWEVHDVSRNKLGFDLMAKKTNRGERYIDVKSSLGLCSPKLTLREWQQAEKHRVSYVLAIIENFSPSEGNVVFWVTNPAENCSANKSTTINYNIPRYQWQLAVVGLNNI